MRKQTIVIWDISSQASDDPIATIKRIVRTVKCSDDKDKIAWHEVTWKKKTLKVTWEKDNRWLGFVYWKVDCNLHRGGWVPVSPYVEDMKR